MLYSKHRNIILFTATVTPQSQMLGLAVNNPEQRFEQYFEAFSNFAKSPAGGMFDVIIVCENSSFDLERFRPAFAECRSQLIFANVPPDVTMGKHGRGYSEMVLMDGAIEQLANEIREDDLIWKLTGRYQVRNLDKVVCGSKFNGYDIVVNIRTFPKKWGDLYLFAFSPKMWRALREELPRFLRDENNPNEIESPELIMYRIVEDFVRLRKFKISNRFASEPHLIGIRGYDQRQYDSGRQKIKRYIRITSRIFTPWIRI